MITPADRAMFALAPRHPFQTAPSLADIRVLMASAVIRLDGAL